MSIDMKHRPLWKSYRFVVLLLLLLTMYSWVSMRSNLGFAIVCMVNSTTSPVVTSNQTILADRRCEAQTSETESKLGYHGTFLWTKTEQAYLFSALFYGSIITVGFAGTLADSFDPKLIILLSIFCYTILTISTPWLAYNYTIYLVSRFLMGLSDGLIFPAICSIVARWFPPNERSTASAVYTSGNQLANSLNVVIAGSLCSLTFFGGWPLIFLIWGAVGWIYIVLFSLLVTNSPTNNRFIGMKEKVYLSSQLSGQHSGLARKKNGFFSAMPFMTQLICKLLMGIGSDALKRKKILSETVSCKILQSLATFGTATVLILMAFFVDCTNPLLGLVLLALMGCLFAGQIGGAFTSSLCIAPPFTGTITSLSSFAGAIATIGVPTTVGYINEKGTRQEWQIIFLIAAGISISTGLFFLIFGSAEIQKWAKVGVPQTVVVQSISSPNLESGHDEQKPHPHDSCNYIVAVSIAVTLSPAILSGQPSAVEIIPLKKTKSNYLLIQLAWKQ